MFLNTCEAGGFEIRAAVANSQASNVTKTVQVATGIISSRAAQIWIRTTTCQTNIIIVKQMKCNQQ